MRMPFSIDECAWVDVYARRSPIAAGVRSRAARMAHRLESDPLCWITPPPGPVVLNPCGQAEQVHQPVDHVALELGARGAVAHNIPCTPRPAATRSPRIDGPDELPGK